MLQREICRVRAAGDRYSVYKRLTARTGPDQEAKAILPREIEVLCMNTGAGNDQVT